MNFITFFFSFCLDFISVPGHFALKVVRSTTGSFHAPISLFQLFRLWVLDAQDFARRERLAELQGKGILKGFKWLKKVFCIYRTACRLMAHGLMLCPGRFREASDVGPGGWPWKPWSYSLHRDFKDASDRFKRVYTHVYDCLCTYLCTPLGHLKSRPLRRFTAFAMACKLGALRAKPRSATPMGCQFLSVLTLF